MFIPPNPDFNGLLDAGIVFCSVFQLFAVIVAIQQNTRGISGNKPTAIIPVLIPVLIAVFAGSSLVAYSSGQHPLAIALYLAISASLLLVLRTFLDQFNIAGHLLLAATIQMTFTGLLWGMNFILQQSLSATAIAIIGLILFISLPMLILGFGKVWLRAALFGRSQWLRPRTPYDAKPQNYVPKVSIHVPCYAEPTNIVIRTLNSLKNLDYPNYEVILIGNNTPDKKLWQPLKTYCETQGEPFRFLHVENLPGAKAGALNHILPMTAKDAEIVAVIDSDYVAEPDFLRRLVGFFHDDRIGFVQTSHDYRLWEERPYQKSCYWEYMPTYKQLLPTLNEWSAAYTVGTMCLVRREALEAAGGWAEWCLTEDSELAIRIHALGYKSVAIADTFGRGLIPETYSDYKKQRYRWTAGPAQQLKQHYRLLLSNFFSKRARMSTQQKFFELLHCTEGFQFVMSMAMWVLLPVILFMQINSGNPLHLPEIFWVVVTAMITSKLLLRWLKYRMLGATLKEMLLAQIASMSLLHTREIASVSGLFSGKPLKWVRTSKFNALPAGLGALKSTSTEMIRGLISLTVAGSAAMHVGTTMSSVMMVGAIALASMGLSYLMAPLMAIFGERDLIRKSASQQVYQGISKVVTDQP